MLEALLLFLSFSGGVCQHPLRAPGRLYPNFLSDAEADVSCVACTQSLDELEDDEGGEKERKREEALTQHNTAQNEALTPDPAAPHFFQETPRAAPGRQRSVGAPGSEEEGRRQQASPGIRSSRQGFRRRGGSGLERRIEELEKELAKERQENTRLLSAHQDKDDLIAKLKEEIDLLNRDLDDIEEENEQLKQENKTLLKVVGQLTR
ncbi:hypothetical protein ANANG_G00309720 [Anguilla anguilla]|uniref:PRKC apoptosis WT1 regulator protein n=1 Tax=Anguilla anguilla TaxID=7936 RepID=A0A9D3LLE4_ANGAN|nr:hypothetical protein ANANG_G00309720 [Anguilla anguilla]